ncbi:hypothetical protein Pint_22774 [Pistacia integerrima]|uniref:Uncharacterized protein n=1 Tax=Pistacia integerrima TaxID=434235 RepID=A0ACC0YP19_9ROSI|nr:hypothetical protein Pint_22774 [Pistacia integerrima]
MASLIMLHVQLLKEFCRYLMVIQCQIVSKTLD